MVHSRNEPDQIDSQLALEVCTNSGTQFLYFPEAVVDALRHMVGQINQIQKSVVREYSNDTRLGINPNFPATFALVSALRGEGVTYTAWALTSLLVNDFSVKACVVDLNWWWPFTNQALNPTGRGIVDVLKETVLLEDVIVPTSNPNLAFLPAGRFDRRERPIFARGDGIKKLISDLSSRYDHIILDIPAIRATHDAIPLAMLAEACGVVIRHGVTKIDDVQQALDEIDHLNILGIVVNQVAYRSPGWLLRMLPQA